MAHNRMALWLVVASVLLVAAWLSIGWRVTLLADRAIPVPATSLPVSPLSYDGGGFVIGGRQLTFGMTNNLRAGLELPTDSSNRIVLCLGREAFVLGPRTSPIDPRGRPEITFVADPGDQLSLTVHESLFGWPNLFEIRFMGGPPPKWKKYVYYRLLWKKQQGARLEMRWRYQREYFQASGWTEPLMMWDSRTGLLSIDIRPS